MKPLTFRLRAPPGQRLDLSPLTPTRLNGMALREIAALPLHTSREPANAGDVFAISGADAERIVFEGGSQRFDRVGEAMAGGAILVEGDVGAKAGRAMTGGKLRVLGGAGIWAASGMLGGEIEISGDAGERLGGALAGEMEGMAGGLVVVRGDVGERAGDHMRRGVIVVEGRAGACAGCRMAAGTLAILGEAGPHVGYLMRRGTILLGASGAALGPTFVDCGVHELGILALLANHLRAASPRAAALLRRRLRRYAGDMAALGKGEAFAID